jgi:hypothetical protein
MTIFLHLFNSPLNLHQINLSLLSCNRGVSIRNCCLDTLKVTNDYVKSAKSVLVVIFSLGKGRFVGSTLAFQGGDLSVDRFDVFGELDKTSVDFLDTGRVLLVGF